MLPSREQEKGEHRVSLIVAKFGGASFCDIESLKNAASKMTQEVRCGNRIVVVVGAPAGKTDELGMLCKRVSPRPNPREYDAVLATGEQIWAGLMALALEQRGLNARSWTGWQVPIQTNADYNKAQILDIDPTALKERLDEGEIAVLTGFQGVAKDGSLTTLGRGGADISAVALAAALKADRCDIYTDKTGIYTAPPALVSRARHLSRVSYEEMLELSSLGAKVMNPRAIGIAMRYGLSLQILSAFGNAIGSDLPGTLITKEDFSMDNNPVTGIACVRDIARVTLHRVSDRPGTAAKIFGALARADLNIDMIVQSASAENGLTDITFTVNEKEANRAIEVLEDEKETIGFSLLQTDRNVAKISIVGSGMRTRSGIAARLFQTLAEKNINVLVVETSEINVSVLVAEEYLELALRLLHTAFNLDK